MNIHDIYNRIAPLFRGKRIQKFSEIFRPTQHTRILDVGGTPEFWIQVPIKSTIIILNLHILPDAEKYSNRFELIVGDGCKLDFVSNQEFDIVFSNSVIEHVGSREKQMEFAREILRVGKGYWVQTPAWVFPIEPHLMGLFIHWFPRAWQKHLVRHFTLWGLVTKPSQARVEEVLDGIRLINYREFRDFFPDSTIIVERWMSLPKAYIAYKKG